MLVTFLFVEIPKPIDGPVKQNAKVIAIYSKIVTNFLIIAIFKEPGLQQVAVPFWKLSQDCAHPIAILAMLQ